MLNFVFNSIISVSDLPTNVSCFDKVNVTYPWKHMENYILELDRKTNDITQDTNETTPGMLCLVILTIKDYFKLEHVTRRNTVVIRRKLFCKIGSFFLLQLILEIK